MIEAIGWSALATGTLLIGMLMAYRRLVGTRWTALIMAFGAGAIISAAAYQLVLGSVEEEQGAFLVVGLGMAVGAMTFYLADRWVDGMGGGERMDMEGAQSGGSGTAILLGSMLDGIPESLVLGLSLVHSPQVSLAFIFAVAISNVPQGLGGTMGMLGAGWAKAKITRLWLAVCVLSIAAAAAGYWMALQVAGLTGAAVDAFAAGALFVMLSDSMIPDSFEHGGKEAGLALTLDFGVATAMALAFPA
jgi:ZIP family zinc transporter